METKRKWDLIKADGQKKILYFNCPKSEIIYIRSHSIMAASGLVHQCIFINIPSTDDASAV